MLDASQPPPVPASFDLQSFTSTSHFNLARPVSSARLPEAPVYLLTSRFRI